VELNCGGSRVRELRFSSEGTDLLTADNAPKGDLQENASLSDLTLCDSQAIFAHSDAYRRCADRLQWYEDQAQHH
jgi:hypothetical protein